MSNIYEVFNTNSDAEFSKFLDKLNLSSNDLLNVIEIAESYDDIQTKRHHLLEFMAGTAQGNYELCVKQFKPKFKRTLKESIKKNIFTMLGTVPAMPIIKSLSKAMDYKEYGGALFLGVKKPVVKAHGSSKSSSISACIEQVYNMSKGKLIDKITKNLEL